MKVNLALLSFTCLWALAGCGGTGVSSGSPVDRDYGVVTTRAVGGVQEPVTMLSRDVGVTGVFGANFLAASVNLPPETQLNEDAILGSTMLAYSLNGRPMLHEYGTGLQFMLNPQIPVFANACSPSFSGSGDQLVTTEHDSGTGTFQLFTYNSDGTGRTRITSGTWALDPSWSPVSTRIVFRTSAGDIWAVNRDGSGLTQLTATPETEYMPKFNPAGTKIYYWKNVGGVAQLWEMSPTGLGQVATSIAIGSASLTGWDFDPTGAEVAISSVTSGTYQVNRRTLATGSFYSVVFGTTDQLLGVTWSPTGSHIAYVRDGGSARIESVRIRDGYTQFIRSLSSTFNEGTPEWGPLVRKRSFIGTSGTLGTNAAGFLVSMYNGNYSSFLAFDATTRNTVDIDVPPPSGFSTNNLFATVTAADSITMLRYVNGMNIPRVTIVDPANSSTWVQGAVVAFDGITGKVSNVIPFNRSRSGEKPARVEANGTVTFRGDFVGVYDADGKKASSGATEIVFDAESGKLISSR